MLNISYPDPRSDFFSPPPPPLPPITTTATTTAAIATAFNLSKVSFWDNTVEPFKLKFYVDLGLLKMIHSYLEDETQPFRLMSFTTLYLYKDSLECKAEFLLKSIKKINNAIAKKLSEKAIKNNKEVRALISILQERTILSLKNINETNKYCFKLKLYQKL
jgi:hypothetical protein